MDGFRFDLAAALARELHDVDRLSAFFDIINQDPVISQVKLIAEPWDVGEGGYQVGKFPPLWAEWNGRYRDVVRRYWKGDDGQLAELGYRLTGSSDLYQRDGAPPLRQRQLRHRARRLHPERPGHLQRQSTMRPTWKATGTAPTTTIRATTARKALPRIRTSARFATARCATSSPRMLLSQGVPMICGGDEIGAHAAGQQQRLLPGQRNQLVRLEPGRPAPRAARVHAQADRHPQGAPQPAPPQVLPGPEHSAGRRQARAGGRPRAGYRLAAPGWRGHDRRGVARGLGALPRPVPQRKNARRRERGRRSRSATTRSCFCSTRTPSPSTSIFLAARNAATRWEVWLDTARPEMEEEQVENGKPYRLEPRSTALLREVARGKSHRALTSPEMTRRYPIGAEVVEAGGAHFRVWAPARKRVEVAAGGRARGRPAFWNWIARRAATSPAAPRGARAGTRYRYPPRRRGPLSRPGLALPAGRPARRRPRWSTRGAFRWTDAAWHGAGLAGPGDLRDAHRHLHAARAPWTPPRRQLPALAELGITVLEVMPVAEFPGRFGWGYDGVDLFAPTRLYGAPDDFRRFVDDAHAPRTRRHPRRRLQPLRPRRQLPEGLLPGLLHRPLQERVGRGDQLRRPRLRPGARVLPRQRRATGSRSSTSTACASTPRSRSSTPRRSTSSPRLGRRVREAARGRADAHRGGERAAADARSCGRWSEGGYGLDALWNDDFHHSARVALTGRNEAYYTDYLGTPQEFISAAKYGYLYQGQRYTWQKKRRGTPGVRPRARRSSSTYLQNHDQIANSGRGLRLHKLDRARAACGR